LRTGTAKQAMGRMVVGQMGQMGHKLGYVAWVTGRRTLTYDPVPFQAVLELT